MTRFQWMHVYMEDLLVNRSFIMYCRPAMLGQCTRAELCEEYLEELNPAVIEYLVERRGGLHGADAIIAAELADFSRELEEVIAKNPEVARHIIG